jgi:hypothetical protein
MKFMIPQNGKISFLIEISHQVLVTNRQTSFESVVKSLHHLLKTLATRWGFHFRSPLAHPLIQGLSQLGSLVLFSSLILFLKLRSQIWYLLAARCCLTQMGHTLHCPTNLELRGWLGFKLFLPSSSFYLFEASNESQLYQW